MQKKRITRLSFVLAVVALIIGAISYFPFLDTYELVLLDLRFKARPIQKINPQIVIVEIGNDTLNGLGLWPLPRDYHATLIKVLSDCGVKAIVFDILFSEPTEEDTFLIQAARQAGNVYYPYAFKLKQRKGFFREAEEFAAPILPELAKAAKGAGHANVLTDRDGKRRRVPLYIRYQGKLKPQLSLKAACDYLGIRPEEIKVVDGKFIRLGKKRRIPIDEEGAVLVNLAGYWKDTFEHYSYYDILRTYTEVTPAGKLPDELARLKDKVCFVGLTATGTTDINPSALQAKYPMIGLHANLFNSIVTGNFLRRISRLGNLAILYFLCLLTIILTLRTKPLMGILYQIALLVSFTALGFLLFIFTGLWIDLFFPLLVCISVYLGANIFRYMKELRRRELLEKELSIARNIQRSFLKEIPEEIRGVSVSVVMDTARYVGGDLYDFVQFPDGRLGLLVGDVSGKGVPAALFMAQVISQFRYLANICSSPSETLTRLNQDITRHSRSGLFVTIAYLIYEPGRNEISFSSAGHLPPFVFRHSQLVEKIEVSEGMPLGLIKEAVFEEKRLFLNKGEMVLLYTDGVTEARDKKGREFGEQRIVRVLQNRADFSSQEAVGALKDALGAFTGKAAQHDDITIMALKALI